MVLLIVVARGKEFSSVFILFFSCFLNRALVIVNINFRSVCVFVYAYSVYSQKGSSHETDNLSWSKKLKDRAKSLENFNRLKISRALVYLAITYFFWLFNLKYGKRMLKDKLGHIKYLKSLFE